MLAIGERHLIITITPNASIDRTYTIPGFGVDRIHRPDECRVVAGGKGVNVARVLKELGQPALATGFVGGHYGDVISRCLDEEGIRHDFVRVEGESRLCLKIMDPTNGTQTEINETGPEVRADEIDAMLAKLADLLPAARFVVLCGSCPPGVPVSFYGEIIKLASKAGVKSVLDTSGDHLAVAIKASPYMVKPNVAELSQLAGRELCTLEEISGAAKSLKQYGVEVTSVTMGRSGAMVTDGVQAWQAVPPEIQFASAVGSGDSFLAGFLDSLVGGEPLGDALAWGTAAGAANATTYCAGCCSKESIIEIRQGTVLSKIS